MLFELSEEEEAVRSAESFTRPAARPRPRILVVDDSRDSADSLVVLLNLLGNDARAAYDGEAALAEADLFRPDAVLLDLGMPEMNGFETCRRLRGHDWGKAMIVVALTGWGQPQDLRATREAGFDNHLVKPVDPVVLGRLLADLSSRL